MPVVVVDAVAVVAGGCCGGRRHSGCEGPGGLEYISGSPSAPTTLIGESKVFEKKSRLSRPDREELFLFERHSKDKEREREIDFGAN